MLSAKNSKGESVYSFNVTKEDGPFFCPLCGEKLILKKGPLKIPHFAHKPNTSCYFGRGESPEHIEAKYFLYTWMVNQGIKAKIEEPLGNGIVDILFYPPTYSKGVSIELQHSFISINEIIDRLKNCTAHNIPSLWISFKRLKFWEGDEIRLSAQERFLSALYYGKGFYYKYGKIFKIHFTKTIPRTNDYYDYEYTPKTIRLIWEVKKVDVIYDFKPFYHKEFKTKSYTLPNCLLWFPR